MLLAPRLPDECGVPHVAESLAERKVPLEEQSPGGSLYARWVPRGRPKFTTTSLTSLTLGEAQSFVPPRASARGDRNGQTR